MLRVTVETIAAATNGRVIAGDPTVIGNDLFVDSRLAAPGSIYVALPGERVDGHDYIAAAIDNGSRVVIVTRSEEQLTAQLEYARVNGAAVVHVADGVLAVQELASLHRERLQASVVGITGSTGKTTTKDLVTAVLATSMRVVSTEGNRNNELGVPLTLLQAGSDTDALVLEMGMRGTGQIARLAQIARPHVGLVTNVGTSHIELLGSQDRIADAKAELVRALSADGLALLNGDDAYSEVIAAGLAAPVQLYGLSEKCDVRATDVELDDASRASFQMHAAQGSVRVSLNVAGRHNVYNALAAAAVGLHLGVGLESIAEGLSGAKMSAMRMETFTSASGVTVINDAYNANPTSMKAAVETLGSMRVSGRRIAVLGDMAELGSLTELAHFEIGEFIAARELDLLVTVGTKARRFADGAAAAGMSRDTIITCDTAEEAALGIEPLLATGDVVLVKASRVMGLEAVVERIVNPSAG